MRNSQDRSILSDLQELSPGDALEELARRGARKLLAQALDAEIAEHLEKHCDVTDEEGRRLVVRTGTSQNESWLRGSGR